MHSNESRRRERAARAEARRLLASVPDAAQLSAECTGWLLGISRTAVQAAEERAIVKMVRYYAELRRIEPRKPRGPRHD